VSPFRDAVGFIYSEQTYLLRTKSIDERNIAKAFRRDIYEAILALLKVLQSKMLFGKCGAHY